VDRLDADDAGDPIRPHGQTHARQETGINAAHCPHLQQTLVVVVDDHQADLIHMGGQHNAHGILIGAMLDREQVAEGIDPDPINVIPDGVQHDRAHVALIARHPVRLRKLFQYHT